MLSGPTKCTINLIASIAFVTGSYFFYPSVDLVSIGGWLFTVGSFGYLFLDVADLISNKADRSKSKDASKQSIDSDVSVTDSRNILTQKLQSAGEGIKLINLLESLIYLVGSILFIPDTDDLATIGVISFIIGSSIVIVAQLFKLYQQHGVIVMTVENGSCDIAFLINILQLMGALFFLIGSCVHFSIDPIKNMLFAILYTIGTVMYLFSSLLLFCSIFFQ